MSRLAKMLPLLYFLVDASTIVLTFFLIIQRYQLPHQLTELVFNLTTYIAVWLTLAYISDLYISNLHNGVKLRMRHYVKNHLYFGTHLILLKLIIPDFFILTLLQLAYFIGALILINLLINFLLVSSISRFRRRKQNIKDTLIIGVSHTAIRITNYFKSNPDFGFNIRGYISSKDEECKIDPSLVFCSLDELEPYLNKHPTNEIIIALPYKKAKSKKIKQIIDAADHQGARISFVPDYEGLFGKNYQMIQDNQLEAVKVHNMPLDGTYPTLEKGIFDFVFSFFTLIILAPVFLFIALWIKLDSKGPVFYCPVRVGRGGKNFKVFKFRTMSNNDNEVGGTKSTEKNDPRITKSGKILRKYNLDELPQFINVLLGNMSVVGPRPHRNYLNEKMKEHVEKYMIRHYFRPGITGWAQVNGWRGPTETEEQIAQRTAHDLWYIENWSFSLDLRIIWMTVFHQKARENAY